MLHLRTAWRRSCEHDVCAQRHNSSRDHAEGLAGHSAWFRLVLITRVPSNFRPKFSLSAGSVQAVLYHEMAHSLRLPYWAVHAPLARDGPEQETGDDMFYVNITRAAIFVPSSQTSPTYPSDLMPGRSLLTVPRSPMMSS